jgi:hypothetical protein
MLALSATLALSWWLATMYGWKSGWPGCWSWVRWSWLAWTSPAHAAHLSGLGGWWLAALRTSSGVAAPLSGVGGLLAGIWIARPGPAVQHLAGRQISDDPRQAAAEMEAECKISGEGLHIHPQIPISMDRETRHLIDLGSVGSGKTVTLLPLIQQAIARENDKLLIFDNKGEFTAILPAAPGAADITTLAPWDDRCVAWDIAADVPTRPDARTIAARLVPESERDPMWGLAAQSILVAVICKFQQEKPGKWDLQDVISDVFAGYDHLRSIVMKYNPEGIYAVEDAKKTKTTQSFLITLSTFLSQVSDLASAWKGKPKISLRRWLLDPDSPEYRDPRCKFLILQGNKRYKKLEQAYIQSVIAALSSIVNSPELPDSRERRLWLFLDEFPQLGKLPEISQFFEIGRSKGCRVVLGVQDVAQIRELYGRETAEAWASMIGTYLICRTQGRETPRWLSELIGQRKILRYRPSYSGSAFASEDGRTRQDNWEEVEEPVIRSEEITTTLGSRREGIEALFFSGGDTVYRLIWPYPEKEQLRPAVVPAPWTQGPQTATGNAGGQAQQATTGTEGGRGIDPQPQQQEQPPSAAPAPQATPQRRPLAEQAGPAADQEQEQESDSPAEAIAESIMEEAAEAIVALPGAGVILDAVGAAEIAEKATTPVTVQQGQAAEPDDLVDDWLGLED